MDGPADNPTPPSAPGSPGAPAAATATYASAAGWAAPDSPSGADAAVPAVRAPISAPTPATTRSAGVDGTARGWSHDRPAAASTDGGGWSSRRLTGGPPPVPVALRPMTVSDLLDGAWAVITCRPQTVLGLTALILVPIQLVASFLIRGFGQALDITTLIVVFFPFFRTEPGRTGGFSLAAMAAVALLSFGYFVLGTAIAKLVSGWYAGRDLSIGDVLRATAKLLPAIAAAHALLIVPKALSIWIVALPALFLFPLLILVAPVMAIEGQGPVAAIRRSARLAGRRYWRVLGIWVVSLLIERVLDHWLSLGPQVIGDLVPDPFGEVLAAAGWAFALLITAPTVAGFATLLYVDLRVRTEGLDLEVEAQDVLAAR